MAAREVAKPSVKAKKFAYKYYEQLHKRVKELESKREALQPKRQPALPRSQLAYQPESSGSAYTAQSEIQAADALQSAAQAIDSVGEPCPEAMAVAEELRSFAHKIDEVADKKIGHVQNRLSFDVFRDVVTNVFQRFPELNVKQRVMAVYHVGASFFLREERSQGPGTQGTIQSWPEQYFREDGKIREDVERAGGLDNILGTSVD